MHANATRLLRGSSLVAHCEATVTHFVKVVITTIEKTLDGNGKLRMLVHSHRARFPCREEICEKEKENIYSLLLKEREEDFSSIEKRIILSRSLNKSI